MVRENGNSHHDWRKHQVNDETSYLMGIIGLVHLGVPNYSVRCPKKMEKQRVVNHCALVSMFEKIVEMGGVEPPSVSPSLMPDHSHSTPFCSPVNLRVREVDAGIACLSRSLQDARRSRAA